MNNAYSNGNSNGTSASNVAAAAAEDTPLTPYEEAISLLNNLQSNAVTIQKNRDRRNSLQEINVPETQAFLHKLGIQLPEIDKLRVIHVSGTKGKGSTCAFVESILRQYGYKTGLYTSPHLVHARERIRIDGKPIDEASFARYFFNVYNTLIDSDANHMPPYFKFLTLLAFHVFIQCRVDVAVVEVGIGGEYDCTNCIENPIVCGISTLDIDHTSLLGSTLPQIAWHKAGILKKGATAFYTSAGAEADAVIKERALQKECSLYATPPFEDYGWGKEELRAGICGEHQKLNIALALQLVAQWLQNNQQNHDMEKLFVPGEGFNVPYKMVKGIEECHWPGRSQIVKTERVKYLCDGAHTPKSMKACAEWMTNELIGDTDRDKRILIFSCTADRAPASLLPYLKDLGFEEALFCPTLVHQALRKKSDLSNFNASAEQQLQRAEECKEEWTKLTAKPCHVFPCISSAIEHIEKLSLSQHPLTVLVTGSLHLIGGVLSIISPNID